MAFPPPVLPTSRTNALPQQDTHPADHNALALAINDTVPVVQTVLTRTGRNGITVAGSTTINAGAVQSLSWQTFSTPSWGAGPNLTAPAGTTGLYILSADIDGPTITAGAFADVTINIGSTSFAAFIPGGKAQITLTATAGLEVGTVVGMRVYNPNATAQSFQCWLNIFRHSP